MLCTCNKPKNFRGIRLVVNGWRGEPGSIESILRSQLAEAIRLQEQRLHEYQEILSHIPHEHSCPADADRLLDALLQENAARNAAWRAIQRLSDFEDFGWIPEDLQPKIAQASA